MQRLILNSRGLNTKIGCEQISKKISDEGLSSKVCKFFFTPLSVA